MKNPELISLHGGHSGQFCCHAEDTLEDIIRQYIRLGFTKVGITEHIPPVNEKFMYPDEKKQGLTLKDMHERFADYFNTLKNLKKKYSQAIRIFAGMETETYTGYRAHIEKLIKKFHPDYIVGSVHHVKDICFDYSAGSYEAAAEKCGSYDLMYEQYFDLQYEMIKNLRPFVVGHFDLIRIHDEKYGTRLLKPGITRKIIRNLELVKSLGLVLDYNLRPLARGEKKPYIAGPVLQRAYELGIKLVPGDDSHGVAEAGCHVDTAAAFLKTYGFSTEWPDPTLL